jgi:hypothetical protein
MRRYVAKTVRWTLVSMQASSSLYESQNARTFPFERSRDNVEVDTRVCAAQTSSPR